MNNHTEPGRRRRQAKLKYIGPELANSDLWSPYPEVADILQQIANRDIARWYKKICGAKTLICDAGCRPTARTPWRTARTEYAPACVARPHRVE